MKKIIVLLTMGFLVFSVHAQSSERSPYGKESEKKRSPYEDDKINKVYMLPENFKVYVKGNQVVNKYYHGFDERTLPVKNHYKEIDGGYVALYTRKKEGSVYSVGGGIYVIGMVRVKGRYIGRIFYPEAYKQGENITQDKEILSICHRYFPSHRGELWIGGDTGNWYKNQTEPKKVVPRKRKAFE